MSSNTTQFKSRFATVERKKLTLSTGEMIETSVLHEDGPLPLVASPKNENVDIVSWLAINRHVVEDWLLRHGAVLFRGFKLAAIDDFERFAASVCPELFSDYGDLPRAQDSARVYGATVYPKELAILFHNESSHLANWPRRIIFGAAKVADKGGETPLVDCQRYYETLDETIREPFEQKGIMYVRNFNPGLDVAWQEFFRTTDKTDVERRCRREGMQCEWKADGGLRIRNVRPAVVNHPVSGNKLFFNQVQLHHTACLEPDARDSLRSLYEEADMPRAAYYGDGSVIPDSIVHWLVQVSYEQAVTFPWQVGDVIVVDNMRVSHGRYPYEGDRKVMVALGSMDHDEDEAS
jgi:alpha-ketoglutarate-dependent taurine dioxygenase